MAIRHSETKPSGDVTMRLVPRGEYAREQWPRSRLLGLAPEPVLVKSAPLEWRVRNQRHLARGQFQTAVAMGVNKALGIGVFTSKVSARVRHNDRCLTCEQPEYVHHEEQWGANAWMAQRYEMPDHAFIAPPDFWIEDYGVVSRRVVTTAGVNFIVDAFQNSVEVELFKYHGYGTNNTAEAAADTTLNTELTTQYATDNTRPTGTQTEGASANIYRSVGVLDPDSAVAIVEHGLFTAISAGTLLDRSIFSAINVAASGDTLETTYEITFTAGS